VVPTTSNLEAVKEQFYIDKENERKKGDEDAAKERKAKADKRAEERLQRARLTSGISAQINTALSLPSTNLEQDAIAESSASSSSQEKSVFSESSALRSSTSSLAPTISATSPRCSETCAP